MADKDFNIIITGTGFSGICVGIQLKKAGINNFKIVEKAKEVGGTWRDNTYPGAACDVKSNLYSYSFEPNPNWTREFSKQAEILAYIKSCVKKYDLEKHISFNWEVETAKYHEDDTKWEIINTKKEKLFANVVIFGNTLQYFYKSDFGGLESAEKQKTEYGNVFYDTGDKLYIHTWHPAVRGAGFTDEDYVMDIVNIVRNWKKK